jgi:regulator of sirC expression with transglutaminase-like and TPR domain
MRVAVVVMEPDGTIVNRSPTEEERHRLAERYFKRLLELSFPGSQVRIRPRSTVHQQLQETSVKG